MIDCPDKNASLIPLSRVVNAAMVDTYADIGNSQQMYFHWGGRGYKQFNLQILKPGKRNVLITVNQNTRTATLPPDFKQELFVGYIDTRTNEKIPIPVRQNLINVNSYQDLECEDNCPKCNQNRGICNDLTVTESVESVLVDGAYYDKTTIKKLYPNGDYFLEITTPYLNQVASTNVRAQGIIIVNPGTGAGQYNVKINGVTITNGPSFDFDVENEDGIASNMMNGITYDNPSGIPYLASVNGNKVIIQSPTNGCDFNNFIITIETVSGDALPANPGTLKGGSCASGGNVEYQTTKEFITNISLLPCGCPSADSANVEVIRSCNYDCYCNYYCPTSTACDTRIGGYKIFEESGLIQFDFNFHHSKVYLEYLGDIPKINGQFAVPDIAFEALVAYIKFKSVENKKSVPIVERAWYWQRYLTERGNMDKMKGRISLSRIIQSLSLNPKFDFQRPWNCGNGVCNTITVVTAATSNCDTNSSNGSGGSGSGGNTYNNTVNNTYIVLSYSTYTEIKLIVDGKTGSPVEFSTTYQNDALIGATALNQITVNKITEYIDQEYTFNGVTGTITRINQWQELDTSVLDFIRLGNGTVNTTYEILDDYIWFYEQGNVAYNTISGNNTLSFNGLTANKAGVLYITQDGTGGHTLTFPAGSEFINGWDGVINQDANSVTRLAVFYDGTTYKWNLG